MAPEPWTVIYIAYVIHVITCIFLILVVLLQQGKGADLSVFGGGTTQAAFGARGAATLLHKLTVGFFVLFLITTMSIGILQRSRRGSSVMQGVETSGEEAPASAPAPIPPAEPGAGNDSTAPPPSALEAQPEAPVDGAAPSGQDAAPPAAPQSSAPGAEAGAPEPAPAAPDGQAPPSEPQPPSGAPVQPQNN